MIFCVALFLGTGLFFLPHRYFAWSVLRVSKGMRDQWSNDVGTQQMSTPPRDRYLFCLRFPTATRRNEHLVYVIVLLVSPRLIFFFLMLILSLLLFFYCLSCRCCYFFPLFFLIFCPTAMFAFASCVPFSLCCGVLVLVFTVGLLLCRGSQSSEGVITLGETSVVTEFQISNDILRKR